jgi:glycosyltransferase involved in cell wall biosynthesis
MTPPLVSVLLPIYNGAAWIDRAVASLLGQTLTEWELIIVDDGSTDGSWQKATDFCTDPRISCRQLQSNQGLGAALNVALSDSRADLIAYLPADDVIYRQHLETLVSTLRDTPSAVLAYSGVRHDYNRVASGQIDGYPLQLVQTMHRSVGESWMLRSELVTDDLDRMFWSRLAGRGESVPTGKVTCEWVSHPAQRHKVITEPEGGINPYRVRYGVKEPLRFHSRSGNRIDEVEHYRNFREREDTPPAPDGLKILLVGELAYNSERILALEERGHRLFGLWMPNPYWYNAVGPMPFGHVTDIPYQGWREAVRRIKPDVIYALLSWQAVPFAHQILTENPGIPFVWHFKEGPFICIEKGTWPELADLYTRAKGVIYSSPEMGQWLEATLPVLRDNPLTMVLDGDLPKADWFSGSRSRRLSEQDGQIHTVVPGRPIGLNPQRIAELARSNVHVHFYGDFTHGQWKSWIETVQSRAPDHLHLHPQVDQDQWVEEFSQYDAGWLHFFESRNGGEILRADWDDLNYPARIPTLAVAGLPLLQRENDGAIVATQALAKSRDMGIFFTEMEELGEKLRERDSVTRASQRSWEQRGEFLFDTHADRLISFFRNVIDG